MNKKQRRRWKRRIRKIKRIALICVGVLVLALAGYVWYQASQGAKDDSADANLAAQQTPAAVQQSAFMPEITAAPEAIAPDEGTEVPMESSGDQQAAPELPAQDVPEQDEGAQGAVIPETAEVPEDSAEASAQQTQESQTLPEEPAETVQQGDAAAQEEPALHERDDIILITATGDVTLGGVANARGERRFRDYAQEYGPDFFFANFTEIFGADDLTIVNLEGPLTNATRERENRPFIFRGEPEYVQILSGSGVHICTVANNHAFDYQEQGFEDTVNAVEEAGMGVSGYDIIYTTEVKGVTVRCVALTSWDYTAREVGRIVAEAREGCDLLIVALHWRIEWQYETDDNQREYAHAAIDAGADLILGNHTHVVGGLELYKGKYIIYSMGNFCFGGNMDPSKRESVVFQQAFRITEDGLENAGINLIPINTSSNDDDDDQNYQPMLLEGEKAMGVIRTIGRYSDIDPYDTLWLDSFIARDLFSAAP